MRYARDDLFATLSLASERYRAPAGDAAAAATPPGASTNGDPSEGYDGNEAGADTWPDDGEVASPARSIAAGLPPSAAVSGLLEFLNEATLSREDSRATEAYAADLLNASSYVRDTECIHEVLDALLKLKTARRGVAARLLEMHLREQARPPRHTSP